MKIMTYFLAAMLGGMTVSWLSASSDTEAVVRGNKFELVDPGGSVVAELAYVDGGPQLVFLDEQNKPTIRLQQTADDSGLYILDEAGHSRIGIALFSHGGAGVALHGPEAKGAAVLYFKSRGSLSFYDPEGEVLERIPGD